MVKLAGEISLRVLSAVLYWSVFRDIEIPLSFFLRSLRNISADFITRAQPSEIERWAASRDFKKVTMPWRRKDFLRGIPKIDWFTEGVERPRYSFLTVRNQLSFNVAEWDASNGIGLQFWRSKGIWPMSINIRAGSLRSKLGNFGIGEWANQTLRCVIGSAWRKSEMRKFCESTKL